MKWRLPEGAAFIGERAQRHPRDKTGTGYYRLIRFQSTGVYSLLGMVGEIRACPRLWAEEQHQMALVAVANDAQDELTLDELEEHADKLRRGDS